MQLCYMNIYVLYITVQVNNASARVVRWRRIIAGALFGSVHEHVTGTPNSERSTNEVDVRQKNQFSLHVYSE